MNKLLENLSILAIVFLLSVQIAIAQQRDTIPSGASTKSYELYMQRHKTFNTLGWILLAPGAAMTVAGVAIVSKNGVFSSDNSGAILGTLGVVMMLGSIPCFIISSSNARKAALELKTGAVPGPGGFNYAAVGVKISF